MIHAFRFHDYNLILDVESGALHSVDEPAFAVVQALEKGWDVYALPYPERQIREIVEEVEALRAAGRRGCGWAQAEDSDAVKMVPRR